MLLRIIGALLLALSLALGSLVVMAWGCRWRASHRAAAQRSALTIPEPDAALQWRGAPLPVAMILGGLGGPPTLHAPLSGRPCAIWEITVYHWNRVENRYDARPVWSRREIGALEIPFARTRHLRFSQDQRTIYSTDESGIFRPTGAVALQTGFIFAHRSQLAPMTTSYLTHLQGAGIPQRLADTIAADMGAYGVKEGHLAPGDRIWGEQMREEFLLGPVAEESGRLLTALLAGSILAALIGYQLLS
jgi:hypothetical protein